MLFNFKPCIYSNTRLRCSVLNALAKPNTNAKKRAFQSTPVIDDDYAPRLSFSSGSWWSSDGGHGTAAWWWWWWWPSWWCTWWCPSMPWCSPPAPPSCTAAAAAAAWWKDAGAACCSATLWWSAPPVDDTRSCRHRLGSVRFSNRSIILSAVHRSAVCPTAHGRSQQYAIATASLVRAYIRRPPTQPAVTVVSGRVRRRCWRWRWRRRRPRDDSFLFGARQQPPMILGSTGLCRGMESVTATNVPTGEKPTWR